jgi:hypothetical protein
LVEQKENLMNTDSKAPDSKANRKVSADAGKHRAAYERTAFGRRRVSKLSKALAAVNRFVGKPIRSLSRRLGRPRGG